MSMLVVNVKVISAIAPLILGEGDVTVRLPPVVVTAVGLIEIGGA
jgi:hypothetical protein